MAAPTKRSGSRTTAQGNGIAAGTSTDLTATQAPLTTSLLVLRVGGFLRSATAATVTDNRGNTWTQEALTLNTRSLQAVATGIWTCRPTTVTAPFVVSYNPTSPGGTHFDSLIYDEIEGFDTGTPIEAAGAGNTGTSSSPSANIADTTNDCLKLGVLTWWDAETGTPTNTNTLNGWTGDGLDEGNSVQAALGVFKSVTGADTSDPSATMSAGTAQWAMSGIAIRGASAAAALFDTEWYPTEANEGPLNVSVWG